MSRLTSLKDKIVDADTFTARVQAWQQAGERVVFTNGVFDLLHRGHVHYLAQAAELGDRLVIGLNSDVSSRSLEKGPSRPIKDQQTRAELLAAFSFVDALCIFDQHTPKELISQSLPNILVKGGDYTPDQVAGGDVVQANGGQVIILDFLPGHSTTALEKKIRGEK